MNMHEHPVEILTKELPMSENQRGWGGLDAIASYIWFFSRGNFGCIVLERLFGSSPL